MVDLLFDFYFGAVAQGLEAFDDQAILLLQAADYLDFEAIAQAGFELALDGGSKG